jgi:hypothetical protein
MSMSGCYFRVLKNVSFVCLVIYMKHKCVLFEFLFRGLRNSRSGVSDQGKGVGVLLLACMCVRLKLLLLLGYVLHFYGLLDHVGDGACLYAMMPPPNHTSLRSY